MFFSISIPVYNAEKYLDICINSILCQTETDYEIILVNDGSTDGSLKICNKWHNDYPSLIRVIDKPNTGSLLTRRICLEESKGEYLYVMDADDYLLSNDALHILRTAIEETKCDMVFFESTSGNEKCTKYPFDDNTLFNGENLNLLRKYFIIYDGFNTLWNKVFHRNLVDWDFDYSPYANVTNGTDMFQTIPIIANAKRALYINQVLYFYRFEQNQNSIVHKFRPTIYTSLKENFLRLKDCSNNWNIPNKDQLLKVRCMKIISTAAYKARLITKSDSVSKYEYLKMIGDDSLLQEYFTLKNLPLARKIIVILLKIKCYSLLAILCSFRF